MITVCVYACAVFSILAWIGWAVNHPLTLMIGVVGFFACWLYAADEYRKGSSRSDYEVHGHE
jgi:hypothetical protein